MTQTIKKRVSHFDRHRSNAPESRASAWARWHAAPLWATLFVVVSGMAVSLLWFPVVDHVSGWLTPGDLWGTFRDAHLIGWGGEADVYQSGTGYLSPPGFPLLLAPIAMLSGALHLTESFPLYLHRPGAWLLLGPAEFLYGAVVLFPIDALARRFGVPRARRVVVVWTSAALCVPQLLLWGHPEDLLAVAWALYGLLAAFDSRWTRSAVLLGIGVAIQPLVVLVVPLVFARLCWRLWAREAGIVALPTALLLAAPVLHTWRTTVHAIASQPTFPKIGHATPWMALSPVLHAQKIGHEVVGLPTTTATTAGGPERILALAIAVAVGAVAARVRPSEPGLVWLATLCLAVRCVFEPVMFPYYTLPALLLVVLGAGIGSRRQFIVALGAAGACLWVAGVNTPPWEYYVLVTVLLLAACLLSIPCRGGAAQQRAGDPVGGTAALGSKGSRVAPQFGSV